MSASEFPGFDRIYDWSSSLDRSLMRAVLVGLDGAVAPHDHDMIRTVTVPIRWRPAGGRISANVIWTSSHAIVLVTKDIAAALTRAKIAGWIAQRAICTDSSINEKYVGVRVTGRCGPLDSARGKWVREMAPGGSRLVLHGFFFAEESWDDTDIFAPDGLNCRLITERVLNILRFEKADNSCFVPLTEIKISKTIIDAWGELNTNGQ